MFSWCFIALSLLMTFVRCEGQNPDEQLSWANVLNGMLSRSCMYGFGVTRIRSIYYPKKKDRLWHIGCSRISPLPQADNFCYWTYDFVNNFEENFSFRCENGTRPDYYMTGFYSDYDVRTADRVWRIECCNSRDVQLKNCSNTPWLNSHEDDLDLIVPDHQVAMGVLSRFNVNKSDRRWRFITCDIKRVPV